MDDLLFQQQLQELKRRVLELSSTYSTDLSGRDPFTSQLADLKAHMAAMQERFQALETPSPLIEHGTTIQGTLPDFEKFLGIPMDRHPYPFFHPEMLHAHNLLLSELGTLQSRLLSAENTISEHEDRLDSLDPCCFTPATSPGATDIFAGVSESGREFEWPCNRGIAWTDDIPPVSNHTFRPRITTTVETPSTASLGHGWQADHVSDPHCDLRDSTQKDTSNSGAQERALTNPCYSNSYDPTSLADEYWRCAASQRQHSGTENLLVEGPGHIARNVEHQPKIDGLSARPAGGVAFRDKEIARMDEQVRLLQEALKTTENSLATQQDENYQLKLKVKVSEDAFLKQQYDLYALRHENEHYERRFDECNAISEDMEAKTLRLLDEASERDLELRKARSQILDMHRNAEEKDRALARWEDSWKELHIAYREANANRDSIGRELRRSESAIDRLNHDHDKEIRALQNFCEQKDVIVHKQEQVIARGGRLLEERDRENEVLQRYVQRVEDDRNHAIRKANRLHSLLDERDAEIQQLKESLGKEKSKSNGFVIYRDEIHSPLPAWRMAETGEREEPASPSDGGRYDKQRYGLPVLAASMIGQASDGSENDGPSENTRRRASKDTMPSHNGNMAYWQYLPAATPRERSTRADTKKSYRDGLKSGWNTQNARNEPVRDSLDSTAGATLSSIPEEHTLRPPLPASPSPPPSPVRRRVSESNLARAYNRENGAAPAPRGLSRHQSLQGMRWPFLQPYVESETESIGGLGGEV